MLTVSEHFECNQPPLHERPQPVSAVKQRTTWILHIQHNVRTPTAKRSNLSHINQHPATFLAYTAPSNAGVTRSATTKFIQTLQFSSCHDRTMLHAQGTAAEHRAAQFSRVHTSRHMIGRRRTRKEPHSIGFLAANGSLNNWAVADSRRLYRLPLSVPHFSQSRHKAPYRLVASLRNSTSTNLDNVPIYYEGD